MSFLKPKVYTPPPPATPAPAVQAGAEDTERAAAMAEESLKKAKSKKGGKSTIVAGMLKDQSGSGGTPTLLG